MHVVSQSVYSACLAIPCLGTSRSLGNYCVWFIHTLHCSFTLTFLVIHCIASMTLICPWVSDHRRLKCDISEPLAFACTLGSCSLACTLFQHSMCPWVSDRSRLKVRHVVCSRTLWLALSLAHAFVHWLLLLELSFQLGWAWSSTLVWHSPHSLWNALISKRPHLPN